MDPTKSHVSRSGKHEIYQQQMRTLLDSAKVKADSVKLIEYLEKRQIECVAAISKTIRQVVRNEDEQLFGNMKLTWGDRDRTRIYELARLFVIVRFILWNLMVLVHYRIVVVRL